MSEDTRAPSPAADRPNAARRSLHRRRTGRSLRNPQPHGLRASAAHAAVRFFEHVQGRTVCLLRDRRTSPREDHGLYRGSVRRRKASPRRSAYLTLPAAAVAHCSFSPYAATMHRHIPTVQYDSTLPQDSIPDDDSMQDGSVHDDPHNAPFVHRVQREWFTPQRVLPRYRCSPQPALFPV